MGSDTAPSSHRTLGVVGLLFIAFFWICGGVYGNETLLEAGPPGYVFLLLLITPLVYALPIALISGELATALPYDGGLVAWVQESCGATIGAHNTYWLWTSYVFDGAVYPILAAEYIAGRAPLEKLWSGTASNDDEKLEKVRKGTHVVAMMIVAFVTGIKLAGTNWMVRSQGVLFVGSLIPVIIFILYGSKDMEPKNWINTDTSAKPYDPYDDYDDDYGYGMDLTLMLAWSMWLYSGFFSLGALAGEVKNPGRAYPIVIVILVPLIGVLNIWPLAVAISLDDYRPNYDAGHFDELAVELIGDWLGWGFVIGAVLANIGLYNAQIVVCERSLAAAFEMHVKHISKTTHSKVVRYLFIDNGTGVAPIFIIMHGVIALVLVWLPYETLVECAILQFTFPAILFLYSFLHYKLFKPDLARPFKVPGQMIGGFLIIIPVLAITFANLYFAIRDEAEVASFAYGKAWMFGILTFLGVIVHMTSYVVVVVLKRYSLCGFSNQHVEENSEYQSLFLTIPKRDYMGETVEESLAKTAPPDYLDLSDV